MVLSLCANALLAGLYLLSDASPLQTLQVPGKDLGIAALLALAVLTAFWFYQGKRKAEWQLFFEKSQAEGRQAETELRRAYPVE